MKSLRQESLLAKNNDITANYHHSHLVLTAQKRARFLEISGNIIPEKRGN